MKQKSNKTKLFNAGRLHTLAEASSCVCFWEVDENQRVSFVSKPFLDQTGFLEDQIIEKKIHDILHPEDVNLFIKNTNTTHFNNIKVRVKSPNNQVSYLLVSGKSIKNKSNLLSFFGMCTIETEHILSGKAVKKLQSINKTILGCTAEAIIIIDKNERIIVVSPAFFNIWNLKKEDIYLGSTLSLIKKMNLQLDSDYENSLLNLSSNLDSNKKTRDLLKFKNSRIIERKSSPHYSEGKNNGRCWSFKDISQQTSLIERLGKMAFRDSLTKLYNRRWCEKKLKQLLKSNKANNLAFLYLDLDHFKVINDSCGHLHGDMVLEDISSVLLSTAGNKSYLARLGGDEFGLILIQNSENEVMKLANSLRSAVSNYSYQWKNKLFKIGVSIGIVFATEYDDFKSVFVHADEACYISKDTGRNKCVVYNAEDEKFQKTKTELKWYDAIQKALLKGKFELWCQPINDLESEESLHYEVLMRMRNEQNKLISPGLFMGSADRFGMIFSIDKQVINSFSRFYSDNSNKLTDILFSINVSGHSLSRDGFLPFVLNCLERHNVNYCNLCFEITESEIIKNLDMAIAFITQMRKLGCKVSLDDFGKGLTSFSYLKNIPFDYIKIDGQFIKEINEDKINAAIIKSIVYIAEVMNKKTIAEHIENEKTFNQIAKLGVNYFQGHYFSEPHQITKLLE